MENTHMDPAVCVEIPTARDPFSPIYHMESYPPLEIARDIVFQGGVKYEIKMDAKSISPDTE
jgi:hypothetical protein